MTKEYFKKLIIVDFDDTLCLHQSSDTSNIMHGKPNIDLICKLNHLYNIGYNIQILTARGHFSCETRKEAEEKFRPDIEAWLNAHSVQYSELSFNKPYGIMYIDDKALRPDELQILDSLI